MLTQEVQIAPKPLINVRVAEPLTGLPMYLLGRGVKDQHVAAVLEGLAVLGIAAVDVPAGLVGRPVRTVGSVVASFILA